MASEKELESVILEHQLENQKLSDELSKLRISSDQNQHQLTSLSSLNEKCEVSDKQVKDLQLEIERYEQINL